MPLHTLLSPALHYLPTVHLPFFRRRSQLASGPRHMPSLTAATPSGRSQTTVPGATTRMRESRQPDKKPLLSLPPSPFPLSRLVATRQQERAEQELRREIELLLTPEEEAILNQNETADVSKISSAKWHPLHTYALALQRPLMDKLLDNGVDIDLLDKDGFTPLHKAIIGKKESVISHLLRKGANPHVADRDGATPLHYAVQVGALQTVKLLIKYRVDVNVADIDGWTPLHLAVQSRNRDIAKILLVNGADQTRRTNITGWEDSVGPQLMFRKGFQLV